MMKITHLAFAFLLGLILHNILDIGNIQMIFISLLGSMVPDIDTSSLLKHRGFLHSLPVLLLFLLFFYMLDFVYLFFYFLLGFVSHLILDCTTKSGIKMFYPITEWKIKGPVVTGGMLEHLILVIIVITDAFILLI